MLNGDMPETAMPSYPLFIEINGNGLRKIAVLLLLFWISALSWSKDVDLIPSRLKTVTANYNFGTVGQDNTVSNKFQIENIGKLDVKILKISKSCSCLLESLNSNIIPAQGKVDILIQPYLKGKVGKFNEDIVLETNSKFDPTVIFNIKGWVAPHCGMICHPKVIDFDYTGSTNIYRTTIKIVGRKEIIEKITIQPSLKFLSIKKENTIKIAGDLNGLAGTSYLISLDASKAPLCSYRTNIDIHSGESHLSIPVEWRTSREVTAVPHTIFFGVIGRGLKSERIIKIIGNKNYELKTQPSHNFSKKSLD